jgi:hypothetical protein
MIETRRPSRYKHRLAPQLSNTASLHQYEVSFRRWLGRELADGRITTQQAAEQFNIPEFNIQSIRKLYAPQVVFLDDMTEAEKHQLEELQKRLKLLEKQLQEATIKNIALETLVDVAEQEFNIPIRKKPGAKQ